MAFVIPTFKTKFATQIIFPFIITVFTIFYFNFVLNKRLFAISLKFQYLSLKNFNYKFFKLLFESFKKKAIDFGNKHSTVLDTILFTVVFYTSWFVIFATLPVIYLIIYIILEHIGDYLNNLFDGNIYYEIIKRTKVAFIAFLCIIPGLFYKILRLLFNGFISIPYRLIKYIIIHIYYNIKYSIKQGDLFLPYEVIKETIEKIFY